MTKYRGHLSRCEFCDEFSGGTANSFVARFANEVSTRTILEQHGFRVLPSLGQIVPGHLLLVPNRHYCALADMSARELRAAEEIKTELARRMQRLYRDLLFFEHGVRAPGSGGCGISHAHLHVVPFPADKDPVEVLRVTFPSEEIPSLAELWSARAGRSYLYYESVRGKRLVFYPQFIPSQYVRRLLAEALGNTEWDWRRCGREEMVLTTLSQVSDLLVAAPSR